MFFKRQRSIAGATTRADSLVFRKSLLNVCVFPLFAAILQSQERADEIIRQTTGGFLF